MTNITTPSPEGIELIKKFEGIKLNAYQCSAGVWTIGYGTTMYPDGRRVQPGDTCTMPQAHEFLTIDLNRRSKAVAGALMPAMVNQQQFDACVSFCYNIGLTAFTKSTLLKKIKANTNDITIRDEFNKWVRAKGKVIAGLQKRRMAEANYYFNIKK